MSREEQQRTRNAMWLTHWQKCEGLGVTMAEYARREGFDAQTAYRWRRFSRLAGQWAEAKAVPGKAAPRTAAFYLAADDRWGDGLDERR